ncbi:MAG: glutathione S-transferase family protein [Polyangiaceae bacterium]|nr:glutathione S-transferase family protein [Polyangiaceae bacterium]
MDFFYGIRSGNSSRSAFALHEAGVDYRGHALHVPLGESRTPDYLALNPMGKVPSLIDGDVELWESNAINWYIAEKHPEAGLLPTSVDGRARVQRWLFFQAAHVSPACMSVCCSTNARFQGFWGVVGDAQTEEKGRRELARYLPVLEAALAHRDWLEGDFSLADIAFAPHLWFLVEGGFDLSATRAVQYWLTRLVSRPAWQKTAAMILKD